MHIEDLDRVYKLETRLFPNPWPKSFFESDLRLNETIAFVLENEGKIIGYSIASMANAKFHITNIAVDEKYQRQGIGSRFVKVLEDTATKNNCNYAYLEVRTNNKTAIDFYESHGYSILYTRSMYYIDGEDAYVMDKELK